MILCYDCCCFLKSHNAFWGGSTSVRPRIIRLRKKLLKNTRYNTYTPCYTRTLATSIHFAGITETITQELIYLLKQSLKN
jgi:hypothetical protein